MIALISTGGTITTLHEDRTRLHDYRQGGRHLTANELVEHHPSLRRRGDLLPIDHRATPSPSMTPRIWLDLLNLIRATTEANPDISAVVLTHGTSSLEETAYFLSHAAPTTVPIVLVGAMRPVGSMSSDVEANLVAAIATSRTLRRHEVVVVINGEIHSPRDIVKCKTSGLDAFGSPGRGPLGSIRPDGSICRSRFDVPSRLRPLEAAEVDALPRVDILYSYAGSDGCAVNAFLHAETRGIVVAAQGAGGVTSEEFDVLHGAVRAGVPVVVSTRFAVGTVLQTEKRRTAGFIAAGSLTPPKARIALMLGLAHGRRDESLEEVFTHESE